MEAIYIKRHVLQCSLEDILGEASGVIDVTPGGGSSS